MRIYNILYFYISMFCTDTCHKQPLGEVLHSREICFVTSLLNRQIWCSKWELFCMLLPLLHHVVPHNDRNCHLTTPVVVGRYVHDNGLVLNRKQAIILTHDDLVWWQIYHWLTLKHRETHGCVVSTVATDALVLKHQAISILSTD